MVAGAHHWRARSSANARLLLLFLPGQYEPLAPRSPPIAAKLARSADHPVAWDEKRQRIARHDVSHGPAGARMAGKPGQFRITDRFPVRDLQKRGKNLSLKSFFIENKGKIKLSPFAAEILFKLLLYIGKIITGFSPPFP